MPLYNGLLILDSGRVLKQVDDIFSLKEEKTTALEAFVEKKDVIFSSPVVTIG